MPTPNKDMLSALPEGMIETMSSYLPIQEVPNLALVNKACHDEYSQEVIRARTQYFQQVVRQARDKYNALFPGAPLDADSTVADYKQAYKMQRDALARRVLNRENPIDFADLMPAQRNDRLLARAGVIIEPMNLALVGTEAKQDRIVNMIALYGNRHFQRDPYLQVTVRHRGRLEAMLEVSHELLVDIDFLSAIQSCITVETLHLIPQQMQQNAEFWLCLLKHDHEKWTLVPQPYHHNRAFLRQAVLNNPRVLSLLPAEMGIEQDALLAEESISSDPFNLRHWHNFQDNDAMVAVATTQNEAAISFASPRIQWKHKTCTQKGLETIKSSAGATVRGLSWLTSFVYHSESSQSPQMGLEEPQRARQRR